MDERTERNGTDERRERMVDGVGVGTPETDSVIAQRMCKRGKNTAARERTGPND